MPRFNGLVRQPVTVWQLGGLDCDPGNILGPKLHGFSSEPVASLQAREDAQVFSDPVHRVEVEGMCLGK